MDAAVNHYQKALEIKPDYVAAHNNLGIALANQGRIEAAIPHLRKVLEINPDNIQARNNLNLVPKQHGRHD